MSSDSSPTGKPVVSARGNVDASFSQIYLNFGEDADVELPWEAPVGLLRQNDPGKVMLTTARQVGSVTAEANVFDAAPSVDPAWSDIVEFSVTAGIAASIDPWDPGDHGFIVPLTTGTSYRARYVVVNGEAGSQQFRYDSSAAPVEHYLVQFWPQSMSPVVVVKNESPWAQYWVFSALAAAVVPTLSDVPAQERVGAVVDLALGRHPSTAQHIRDGDERYMIGIIAYVQALTLETYHQPEFAYLRDDSFDARLLIGERLA